MNPTHSVLPLSDSARRAHLALLLEVTQIPTAAGREQRVIDFITRWVTTRPDLAIEADPSGNLVVSMSDVPATARSSPPLFITAHLDHPAFVVEQALGDHACVLSFRGGVMAPYFESARIVIHTEGGATIGATLAGREPDSSGRSAALEYHIAELDGPAESEPSGRVSPGEIATWALPPAEVDAHGLVHTNACDDLSAVAAALATLDTLRTHARHLTTDVRLLFTRAEEIGFIGAIAACKHGTMPKGSRVLALENSRSFPHDSPIGGGPIVRVGDRMSIFTPSLTAACAKRAEELFAKPAQPLSTQKAADTTGRPWQRKLMSGGACEATVYCAYGYEATCLCLPLGNYHNMANLAEVQDGTYDREKFGPPRIGREFISASDYHGLIDLLVGLGLHIPATDQSAMARLENLYNGRSFVLGDARA